MTAKLDQFLELLQATETEQDLQKLVENLRDVYDINNVVYHAINSKGEHHVAYTYSNEWAMHYHSNDYVKVDPVVRTAFHHFHPMNWKSLDWSNKTARTLYHEAADSGIGNQGYTVPIRGPNGQFALLSVNNTATDASWEKFSSEYKRDMLLISHFLHQKATEIVSPEDFEAPVALSPRERDALAFMAQGQSRGQAADALKISEHTLRVYLDSARNKLRALNTVHAVALAYKNGTIIV